MKNKYKVRYRILVDNCILILNYCSRTIHNRNVCLILFTFAMKVTGTEGTHDTTANCCTVPTRVADPVYVGPNPTLLFRREKKRIRSFRMERNWIRVPAKNISVSQAKLRTLSIDGKLFNKSMLSS